jgi:phosphoribosylanthranilate isomerase
MRFPIVKICGVTREDEVAHLAAAGADFFGLQLDIPSPWTISRERAKTLAALANRQTRAALVTRARSPMNLERLVRETGVTAIQLRLPTPPAHIAHLRAAFSREELAIFFEICYARGRFWHEELIDEYLSAGADFILLDKLAKSAATDAGPPASIPPDDLAAFRKRHPGRLVIVAGGVSAGNCSVLMAASGAIGVDVCTSVRRDGLMQPQLVATLIEQIRNANDAGRNPRPSLRATLATDRPGNQLIAYLTIGDPPQRFRDVAEEVLRAGALTLELGFPFARPVEGATLSASHQRALNAGMDAPRAVSIFRSLAERHPATPLVAVVQWPAIKAADASARFFDALANAGAAAVLPVGLPLWALPALAALAEARGLQTVVACPPDVSSKYRDIALRYCTGCLYVPRARITGSAPEFANVAEFCRLVDDQFNVPIVVGVGVKNVADVTEICRTPAKAAVVGSALVEHVARGGSAGDFVRRLLMP